MKQVPVGGADPYHVHDNGDGTMNIYYRLTGPTLPLQHRDVYVTLNAETGARIGDTVDLPASMSHTSGGHASGQMLQQAVSLADGTIAIIDQHRLKIVNADGTAVANSLNFADASSGASTITNHDSQLLFDLTEVGNKVAVTWAGFSDHPAYMRIINKDGTFASEIIKLGHAGTPASGNIPAAQLETLSDGRILAVWVENGANAVGDADQTSTWFSILNVDGSESVGATLVNTEITKAREDTPLAIATESGFVIGYSVLDFAGTQEGRLKEYNKDGTLLDIQTGAYIWGVDDIVRTDNNTAFIVGGNIYEITLPGADTPLDGGTGGGDKTLTGTSGKDTLEGGAGDDLLLGKSGRDRLLGADGDDLLLGGGGHDRQFGGKGHDTLKGGAGRDKLFGEQGRDLLEGSGGNDRLLGGGGADILKGGKGNDTLDGGRGNDRMFGGSGADIFVFKAKGGKDAIRDFQDDIDTIHLDDALWKGTLSRQQVIDKFADVVGNDIVFDFGKHELKIKGFTDLDALTDDIEII